MKSNRNGVAPPALGFQVVPRMAKRHSELELQVSEWIENELHPSWICPCNPCRWMVKKMAKRHSQLELQVSEWIENEFQSPPSWVCLGILVDFVPLSNNSKPAVWIIGYITGVATIFIKKLACFSSKINRN